MARPLNSRRPRCSVPDDHLRHFLVNINRRPSPAVVAEAASGMGLAVLVSGEAGAAQLTVAPSRQPGTGPRQGLPAGIESCVTPAGHRKCV